MTVTGKGNFPFISSWANDYNVDLRKDILHTWVSFGDTDQTLKTVMSDWFFEVAGGTAYSQEVTETLTFTDSVFNQPFVYLTETLTLSDSNYALATKNIDETLTFSIVFTANELSI